MSWRDRAIPTDDAPKAGDWQSRATPAPQAITDPGTARAALTGLGQGLTFGFGDELGAAGQALAAALSPDQEMRAADVYRQARAENRREVDVARATYPLATGAAELAGGVVSGIATAPLLAAAAPAATWGQKALLAARQGALLGGVSGLGNGTSDDAMAQAKDIASGATVGAVLGGGLSATASGVVGAVRRAPEWLRNSAAFQAMKAVGFRQADMKKLDTASDVQRMGRLYLDNGVVRPFSGAEATGQRLESMAEREGQTIRDALAAADEASGGTGGEVRAAVRATKAEQAQSLSESLMRHSEIANVDGVEAAARRVARAPADERVALAEALANALEHDDVQAAASAGGKTPPTAARQERVGALAAHIFDTAAGVPLPRGFVGAARALAEVDPRSRAKAARELAAAMMDRSDPSNWIQGRGFDVTEAARRLRSEVQLPDLGHEAQQAQLDRFVAKLREMGRAGQSFSEANFNKSGLQDLISNFQDVPATRKVVDSTQRVLRQEIDRQMEPLLGDLPVQEFQRARYAYGTAKAGADANARILDAQLGNRQLSPSDYGMGIGVGASASAGGEGALPSSALAAMMAIAHKAWRTTGAATTAVGMNGAANVIEHLPKVLVRARMDWLSRVPAQRIAPYLEPLTKAAMQGPERLATTDFLIAQQPQNEDYRRMRTEFSGR
jgi:hypothetical protein